MINPVLVAALVSLDDWLTMKKINIRLDVMGGVALHLHDIEMVRATMDIDVANVITNQDVLHKIREIGRFHGLDETWIESPGFPIPSNAKFATHRMFKKFRRIDVQVLSLNDLILTKIAAYYDRKHLQTIDATDLEAIIKSGGVFNEEVLQKGITFIRHTRFIDEERITEVINDLRLLY